MRWPVDQSTVERPLMFEALRFANRSTDTVLDDVTIARL
jgi:hypothetical protein